MRQLRLQSMTTNNTNQPTRIITLDLTDEEIEILKAGVGVQVIFAKPGLNFQDITDAALHRSAVAQNLKGKVENATDGVPA